MPIALRGMDVLMLAGYALIAGLVFNSRNTVGVFNAVGNIFIGTFNAAASTIR